MSYYFGVVVRGVWEEGKKGGWKGKGIVGF